MIKPAIPNNESQRLATLDSYKILHTLPEKDFDELTQLAAAICEAPISLISLISHNTQWFKSKVGLNVSDTSRELAFCAHAINTPNQPFVVEDARLDERFFDNPLVTDAPNVIFYAGVPLVAADGSALGTICVIDNKPRKLNEGQLTALNTISNQICKLLDLRLNNIEINKQKNYFKNRLSLLEQANEVARIGWWEYDLSTLNFTWSGSAKKIFGVDEQFETTLEKTIDFIKEGLYRQIFIELIAKTISNGTGFDKELIITNKEGKDIWIRVIGTPIIENEKVVRINGSIQDINKSKNIVTAFEKAQQKVLNHSRYNKLVVENHSFYVARLYLNGTVNFVNNYLSKQLNLQKNDFLGKSILQIIAHKDHKRFKDTLRQCYTEPNINQEIIVQQKVGDIKLTTQWEVKLMMNEEGKPSEFLLIGHDITPLIKKQYELQALADITTQQNRKLTNFTHIMSHNLRSHVANLIGLTSIPDLCNEQEKATVNSMIKKSVQHMDETITYINQVINIQSNKNIPVAPLNLKDIVERNLQTITKKIADQPIDFTILLTGNEIIQTNQAYLDDFLINLFTNAIQYKAPNKLTKIEVGMQQTKGYKILYVKDNGLGIDIDKNKDKLFGMYKTFHNNEDAKGLSLFIMKNQIEALNGKLEVESTVGVGSTFKIFFAEND